MLELIAPPKFPSSYRMPTETLQQIYDYLGPRDFNAARHTCRNWMRVSLDKNLLAAMLSRGGWSTKVESNHGEIKPPTPENSAVSIQSEEWLLSRRLSRQCALAAGWTGNGFDNRPAIVESFPIDFTELENGHSVSAGEHIRGLVFSASACGRFLLVARDTLIYIYNFREGSLEPVTAVVCPRLVLSVSMDASQGRHAVAAILEGRMGIVCGLRHNRQHEHESSQQRYCTQIYTSSISQYGEWIKSPEGPAGVVRCNMASIQEPRPEPFTEIHVRSHCQSVGLEGIDNHRMHDKNLVNHTWNLSLPGPLRGHTSTAESRSHGLPIECGTSTLYRHLCSEDDPPRCVAVCPQRRCVAFGCSAGIELHWIDALTGQSLSR
jgi:hypothetical protein